MRSIDGAKAEWVAAIELAARDAERAVANRDRLVREAVRAGLSYRLAGEAARRTEGWAHQLVNR